MPKEKILYICDEKHNSQDAPLELKESVPYPENLNYGEKDSVHYYYQCPTCSRVYIAYQRVGKPLEWSAPARDVWEKRLNMVRDARINIVKKGLDEQKQEIERALKETARQLNEIALGKEGIIKEIEKKNLLLEQFKKDEQELSKKSARESEELAAITQKIDSLIMSSRAYPRISKKSKISTRACSENPMIHRVFSFPSSRTTYLPAAQFLLSAKAPVNQGALHKIPPCFFE